MNKKYLVESFVFPSSLYKVNTIELKEATFTQDGQQKTIKVLGTVEGPVGIVDAYTANKTYYSESEVKNAIDKLRPKLESGAVLGLVNHPEKDKSPSLWDVGYIIRDYYIKEHNGKKLLMSKFDLIDSEGGRLLKSILDAGGAFGTSIRGYGNLEEDGHVVDYELQAHDSVYDPSASTFIASFNLKESNNNVRLNKITYYEGDENMKTFRELKEAIDIILKKKPEEIEKDEISKLIEDAKKFKTLKKDIEKLEELQSKVILVHNEEGDDNPTPSVQITKPEGDEGEEGKDKGDNDSGEGNNNPDKGDEGGSDENGEGGEEGDKGDEEGNEEEPEKIHVKCPKCGYEFDVPVPEDLEAKEEFYIDVINDLVDYAKKTEGVVLGLRDYALKLENVIEQFKERVLKERNAVDNAVKIIETLKKFIKDKGIEVSEEDMNKLKDDEKKIDEKVVEKYDQVINDLKDYALKLESVIEDMKLYTLKLETAVEETRDYALTAEDVIEGLVDYAHELEKAVEEAVRSEDLTNPEVIEFVNNTIEHAPHLKKFESILKKFRSVEECKKATSTLLDILARISKVDFSKAIQEKDSSKSRGTEAFMETQGMKGWK